jgi:hypothetical protein
MRQMHARETGLDPIYVAAATGKLSVIALAVAVVISPMVCLAGSEYDGTYSGTPTVSPQVGCDITKVFSVIREGILYDGKDVRRGKISEGQPLTWEATTSSSPHYPLTIKVSLSGEVITSVVTMHGGHNCVWVTRQERRKEAKSDKCRHYNMDYDGATGKHPVLDQAGKPICSELIFP